MCIEMLGCRVMIRTTSAEFGAEVARLFSAFAPCADSNDETHPQLRLSVELKPPSTRPNIRPFHFVYRECNRIGKSHAWWRLMRYLEWQLDIFLAENVTGQLLLHGGAVAMNDAGLLLLGESGSGKSSLSLALTQQGATYYTDDIVAIDPAGRELHTFPKSFSVKNVSLFPALAQQESLWLGPSAKEVATDKERSKAERLVWYIHPDDVRLGSVARQPAAVRYIVYPRYKPGAAPQLTPLSPNQSLRLLLENSINFHKLESNGLALLSRLVRGADSYQLTAGNLSQTVDLLQTLWQTREPA